MAGLERLFYSAYFDPALRGRVRLYVPAPVVPHLQKRLADYPGVLAEGGANFWDAFQVIPVGDAFWHDGVRLEVFEARHHWPRTAYALRLQGSAAYVHSEITEFIGINRLGREEDFAGNRFPNTPRWQVNGQASYDQPLTDRLGLRGVVNASYQSTATGALGAGPDFRIKPYTLVNANLALYTLDDRLSAGLFVRNLFDRYYWSTVDTVIDTIFRVPGQPRTWGGTISVRFK